MAPCQGEDYPLEEWIQLECGGFEIGLHRADIEVWKKQPTCAFKLVFNVTAARKRQALR